MAEAATRQGPGWLARDVWQRLALVAWGLILLGALGRGLLNTPTQIGIYSVYAEAGRHWLAGADLYPESDGWDMFPYSPVIAVFFVPYSFLPDALGSGAYRLTLCAVYLAALAWWARAALPVTMSRTQRALLFLLVLPVTAASLTNGQAGVLVISMILLCLAAAAGERWTLAAVFAVLATLIKAYPVCVGLLLLVCYPRRFGPRFVLALAAGLALPFLFQSPGYVAAQYGHWVHLLRSSDRHDWHLNIANRDVTLLFRVWLAPMPVVVHRALQLLTAAGVAAVCVQGRRAGWPRAQVLWTILGLAGCWMTLLGPVVESFTYILIGPTLAWMLVTAWQTSGAWFLRLTLSASWAIFTGATLAVWFGNTTRLHNMGPHPVAGLLLLVCLLTRVWQQFRSSPPLVRPEVLSARAGAA